jgi:hypothetical protein
MSRFSGKQHKGAMREYVTKRRENAVKRNEMWTKIYEERNAWDREAWGPTPTERLLLAIYGIDMYQGLGEQVPVDPSHYGDVIPETGDITYLGGTMIAGVDF